jgi:hypothetical protein
LACAMPAAVTMFSAPGPIELVATMIWRRRFAFANAMAAIAMDCSFCPRHVGKRSFTASRASPRHVTFPCPKIAKTPGKRGASSPSISVRWAMRNLTTAPAVVRRIVSTGPPFARVATPVLGLTASPSGAYGTPTGWNVPHAWGPARWNVPPHGLRADARSPRWV